MIFKTQTLLTITLDTGVNITTASVKRILYEKPDGTRGYWEATALDTTKLTYSLQTGDESAMNQTGLWKFQAYVEMGGLKGFGDIVETDFKHNLL